MTKNAFAIIPNRIERPDQAWLLKKCLESLFDVEPSMAGRVIVCDDHSPLEKEMMAVVEKFPVKLMKHKTRVNYSRMINSGMKVARDNGAEILITPNNDIEFQTRFLMELDRLFTADEALAVVGCLLFYPDGSIQHGGVDVTNDGGGYCTDRFRAQAFDKPSSRYCHHVTGAWQAINLRRSRFTYDERFPITFQDVDFNLRLWERGLRTYFTNKIFHIHHEGATRGKVVTKQELDSSRIFKSISYDFATINANTEAASLHHASKPLLHEVP
jgi:GT2 family glycosyltransferase